MDEQEFQNFLEEKIPLVSALKFELKKLDEFVSEGQLPLATNGNHRGSAFGGSLYTGLVLTCYSWLYGWLKAKGLDTSIVIQSANIEYLWEATDSLIRCQCKAPAGPQLKKFESWLQQKGKARLTLTSTILSQKSQTLATLSGQFVVFKKSSSENGA